MIFIDKKGNWTITGGSMMLTEFQRALCNATNMPVPVTDKLCEIAQREDTSKELKDELYSLALKILELEKDAFKANNTRKH